MRPGIHLTRALVFVDRKGSTAPSVGWPPWSAASSGRLRRVQTGYVRSYALTMLLGVVVILGAVWVVQ